MTSSEFNIKWIDHLEFGHYGMSINDEEIIKFVDSEFEKLKEKYPNFEFSQIKMKFGSARAYIKSEGVFIKESHDIEHGINEIEKSKRDLKMHKI